MREGYDEVGRRSKAMAGNASMDSMSATTTMGLLCVTPATIQGTPSTTPVKNHSALRVRRSTAAREV